LIFTLFFFSAKKKRCSQKQKTLFSFPKKVQRISRTKQKKEKKEARTKMCTLFSLSLSLRFNAGNGRVRFLRNLWIRHAVTFFFFFLCVCESLLHFFSLSHSFFLSLHAAFSPKQKAAHAKKKNLREKNQKKHAKLMHEKKKKKQDAKSVR
jgi:hypothetical protein